MSFTITNKSCQSSIFNILFLKGRGTNCFLPALWQRECIRDIAHEEERYLCWSENHRQKLIRQTTQTRKWCYCSSHFGLKLQGNELLNLLCCKSWDSTMYLMVFWASICNAHHTVTFLKILLKAYETRANDTNMFYKICCFVYFVCRSTQVSLNSDKIKAWFVRLDLPANILKEN